MQKSTILAVAALVVLAGCAGTGQGVSGEPKISKAFPFGPQDLMIHTSVMGAGIKIDGRPFGDLRTEQLFCLGYGLHKVIVESPGYEPYRTSVYIAPLNTVHVMVTLKPLPGDKAAALRAARALGVSGSPMGAVEITVNVPATEVYIDGRFYGDVVSENQPQVFRVPFGMHRVVLRRDGYQDYAVSIDVNESNVPRLVVTMNHAAAQDAAKQ